ncbi:MAG: GerMN domain-containing protein [Treponema sp.]|jgi:hypothetical protein|nr:GerMN domain-containing protein [Treponema sp.]
MAARKTAKKTSRSDGPKAIVVFWLIFAVVIISIALFNWSTINRNFNLFKTRLTNPPGTEKEYLEDGIDTESPASTPEIVVIEPERRSGTETNPAPPPTAQTPQPPASPPPAPPTVQTPKPPTPAPPTVQTRERAVYFANINNDGQILQSRVTRRLPVSETPLQDVINAMLAGPAADELSRNMLNLIPKNTRLLSATVRGSTAYLNFSEDFMFNTYGVEGYVAQLKQIVWTATEFPNIRDVQILIDGRRVDYLAEGILIGSPIGRQSF